LKESNTTITADRILHTLTEGEEIFLDHCRITGPLDFNSLITEDPTQETDDPSMRFVFSQSIHISSCVFEGDVVFSGPWEQPDRVQITFEGDVVFNSTEFHGQTRFSNSCFKKLAGFDGCTFNRVCAFRNCVFEGMTMFRTAVFEGYGLFNGTGFRGDTRFANTCFGKGANFTDVVFGNRCDFGGVYARNKSVPNYENVSFARTTFGDDASFWRFIKQVCQEAGYYQEAGESFYRERCAHFWKRFRGISYEKLSLHQKAARWLFGLRLLPELLLGRLLFGYGERPVRVLGAGAVIIFICALFYSSTAANLAFQYGLDNAHPDAHLTFWEGLYYSTVTFTTLGFGDIYPAADGLTRAVTMSESLAGACLVALFVVSLSKRFSRG
jgi:hypothetical protein